MTDRVAVISDIHGNRWALQAVLADIDNRGIERILNLGDSLYGPLDPSGTARILIERGIESVSGNEDRILLEGRTGSACNKETLDFVKERLGEEELGWLGALKSRAVTKEGFLIFHGTPERDDTYLLHEVTREEVRSRKRSDLERMLPPGYTVVMCGHDHVQRTLRLANAVLIVDPGSVGLPAYTDDVPFPHAMENGTPHARYSVIYSSGETHNVEEISLFYDWEAAARTAEGNGYPDWALWLRTGRANLIA